MHARLVWSVFSQSKDPLPVTEGGRLREVKKQGSEVAWSHPEKQALRGEIRKWWCNINWWWCMPGTAGLSGVCLPKEMLSGAERDRQDESLTLSVSWWRRGGLGNRDHQSLTHRSTLCQSTASLLGHTNNKTDTMTQWGRQTEWVWSPRSNIKTIKKLNFIYIDKGTYSMIQYCAAGRSFIIKWVKFFLYSGTRTARGLLPKDRIRKLVI